MILSRVRALALALLVACAPVMALGQSQPAPTAKQGASTIPRDTTPTSIFIAPAGGGYGPGKVVAADQGFPVTCLSGCSSPVAFTPLGGGDQAAGTTSARAALTSGATAVLINNGSADLFYKLGNSSVVAATTDPRLPAGRGIVVAVNANTHVAVITASGTSSLSFTTGNGSPLISGGAGGSAGGASLPFTPVATTSLSATTSSSQVALPSADDTTLVTNLGTTAAFVKLGTSPVTAATTDLVVGPGTVIALNAGDNTHIAAITASGSATLSITTGTGIPALGVALDSSVVPISATALPLPTGAATAAKQPALGTAGTPAADVITVQGVANGTPQPVGGLVADGGAMASAGNPVVEGCLYEDTPQSVGNQQITRANCDPYGKRGVFIGSPAAPTTFAYIGGVGDGSTAPGASMIWTGAVGQSWNGSSWDLNRGDVAGQVVQPYAMRSSRWSYAAASGGIANTTTAVTVKAAAGAGVRNCLVSAQVSADALTNATELAIRDGAAGTVLWRAKIQTAGLPLTSFQFPAAVCGTANTLLEAVTLTASGAGAVYVNLQGYVQTP